MKSIAILNNKGGCGKSTITMALADAISAQIVDLDPQKTLSFSSEFTGRHKPIEASQATARWLIYDTPPYRESTLNSVLKNIDYIIIPVLVGYPDLLATKPAVDLVVKLNLGNKTTIVLNKVRRPYNKNYEKIKGYFKQNYPSVKLAKTELSELKGFQDILVEELGGKAKEQIIELVKEILIKTNI